MTQSFFSSSRTSASACAVAALMGLHALPSLADTVNTTPATCNVLAGANIPAGALQYVGSGRFERKIDREVSTGNPKVYPFRTQAGTVTATVTLASLPPPNSQWQSNRPAIMEVQQPDANGNWTTVCTKTVSAGNTGICNAAITKAQARIKMSTTNGANANDNKSAFTLTYNFTGPTTTAEAEKQSTTATTVGQTLAVNQTTKATLAGTSTLPGAFEGQALRLIITRSDVGVLADPNGPKLKGDSTATQDDGTDFVCTNWYGAANETKVCEVVGTATSDSIIHMPFQLAFGTGTSSAHWATVEVQRQFANGYVQNTDPSKEFAKTCY